MVWPIFVKISPTQNITRDHHFELVLIPRRRRFKRMALFYTQCQMLKALSNIQGNPLSLPVPFFSLNLSWRFVEYSPYRPARLYSVRRLCWAAQKTTKQPQHLVFFKWISLHRRLYIKVKKKPFRNVELRTWHCRRFGSSIEEGTWNKRECCCCVESPCDVTLLCSAQVMVKPQ